MKRKASRQIIKLLKIVEEKQEELVKCEEKIDEARRKLENREKGWSKARFTKVKMKYTEKVRGLRGGINRLEKQRLNIERRERDREEEELEELERTLAVEAEEERLKMKKRKSKKRSKMKKKKKAGKKKVKKEKKVKKVLTAKERRMHDFAKAFVKSYRSGLKAKMAKKKDRKRHELYGKYPYKVTVVFKEPEAEEEEIGEGEEKKVVKKKAGPIDIMLVFSSPGSEKLEIDSVEERAFNLGNYKDIFRTVLLPVAKWSESEAKTLAGENIVRDTE